MKIRIEEEAKSEEFSIKLDFDCPQNQINWISLLFQFQHSNDSNSNDSKMDELNDREGCFK
jgi:hypothetical protein